VLNILLQLHNKYGYKMSIMTLFILDNLSCAELKCCMSLHKKWNPWNLPKSNKLCLKYAKFCPKSTTVMTKIYRKLLQMYQTKATKFCLKSTEVKNPPPTKIARKFPIPQWVFSNRTLKEFIFEISLLYISLSKLTIIKITI